MAARSAFSQQIYLALIPTGPEAAIAIACEAGHQDPCKCMSAVAGEAPSPSFSFSTLGRVAVAVRLAEPPAIPARRARF